jgi:hypothetical protein
MPRSRPTRMSDQDALQLFIQEALRLFSHPLWRDGYVPKVSVKMEIDKAWETDTHEPTPELLESFLLRLRPLLAKGEPLFVDRIRNVAKRYSQDQSVRDQLDEELADWQMDLAGGGIKVVNLGDELLPEDAWNSYINGHYFHRNEEERAKLLSLADPIHAMHRFQFLRHIFDATRYVNNVAAISQEALENRMIVFPVED